MLNSLLSLTQIFVGIRIVPVFSVITGNNYILSLWKGVELMANGIAEEIKAVEEAAKQMIKDAKSELRSPNRKLIGFTRKRFLLLRRRQRKRRIRSLKRAWQMQSPLRIAIRGKLKEQLPGLRKR
jgi:hypothetical protein